MGCHICVNFIVRFNFIVALNLCSKNWIMGDIQRCRDTMSNISVIKACVKPINKLKGESRADIIEGAKNIVKQHKGNVASGLDVLVSAVLIADAWVGVGRCLSWGWGWPEQGLPRVGTNGVTYKPSIEHKTYFLWLKFALGVLASVFVACVQVISSLLYIGFMATRLKLWFVFGFDVGVDRSKFGLVRCWFRRRLWCSQFGLIKFWFRCWFCSLKVCIWFVFGFGVGFDCSKFVLHNVFVYRFHCWLRCWLRL